MKKFIPYIALIFVVASCAAPKVVIQQRDSTVIHIKDSLILRDSIIFVPVPMGEDKAKLPDTDTSYLETTVAKSTAFIDKGGKICHTLTNKSDAIIPIKVTIPMRLHSEEKGLTRYLKQVERIEVEKELSRWQRFLQGLGWTALIVIVLWIINKVRKFIV
jgi:hypothetical protein